MANPNKQGLSRALTDMKFMKRCSAGGIADESEGALIEKWYAVDIPKLTDTVTRPEIHTSYVEFEDLNKLGRFSYNKYNKEIEDLMRHYHSDESDISSGEIRDDEGDDGTVEVAEVVERYEELGMTKKKLLGKRKHT